MTQITITLLPAALIIIPMCIVVFPSLWLRRDNGNRLVFRKVDYKKDYNR